MQWFVQGAVEKPKAKVRQLQAFKDFIRIFSYSTASDKIWLAVSVFASIATGVTLPLMNVIFARLIRTFTAFYGLYYTGYTAAQFRLEINQYVLYMVYIFITRFVLAYFATLGARTTSLRISAAMRLAYMRNLLALPVSSVDTIPPGSTASTITMTASIVQNGIAEKLSTLIQTASLMISAIVIAFIFSWQLTMVTITGLVFVMITFSLSSHFITKRWKAVEVADKTSAGVAAEAMYSMRMIAACGAEDKMAARYSLWVDEAARRGASMSPWLALQYSPAYFAIYATLALCFWYSIQLYMKLEITSVETLLVVITSILTIVMSVGGMAAPLQAVTRATGAAKQFWDIIDRDTAQVDGLQAPEASAEEDIVLQRVNFAYPARPDYRVLSNVTVTFPAGKTTAIVGPSGAGKSTIVGLLQRWYEIDGAASNNAISLFFRNGAIKCGEHRLHDLNLKWWRSQIGLVQQEPVLFNDSIFKNVAYGLIGTHWEYASEETKRTLVADACREAYAEEFISRLPDNYDTQCGDAGIKLSGGQRQRLAIARSIVRKPKILILDEATSAIDVRSEQKVQLALEHASRNRTTIIIAHRLSTIQKADNIVVLRRGMVVQQGTHEKLMKNRAGVYHRLATAQEMLHHQSTEADDDDNSSEFIEDEKLRCFEQPEHVRQEFECDDATPLDRRPTKGKGIVRNFGIALVENRRYWYWFVLLILGSMGAGAAFPLQAYLFARLVSLFSFYGDYLRDQTNLWTLVTVLLAIGVGICYFALTWASSSVSWHIISGYRKDYFANMLRKSISFFDEESHSVGALTARIATDPAQIQQLLGVNAGSMLTCIFNVVGCIVISFYYSWRLSIVIVFAAMPIIVAAGFLRVRFEWNFEKMNFSVFTESSKFATEAIAAFRTVNALTMEQTICDRYEIMLNDHVKSAFEKAKWQTWIFAFSDSVSLLCMAFALWYGGKLLSEFKVHPFNYLIVYIAIVQGSLGAGQWLSFGPNIAQANAAANRIHAMRKTDKELLASTEIADTIPEQFEEAMVGSAKNVEMVKGARIELRDVWFEYPTRKGHVLRGLNMSIEPGQFAAIVGPSGSGKTSIISLLERFYTANSGQILYNSAPINTLPIDSYRSKLSLVSQEPSIFSGSITDNITLGIPSSHIDNALGTLDPALEAKLAATTRSASLYDFISSLPNSYSTPVGHSGVALSGGQKQRLALARALIRDPKVLLLDEATSNLDSETEKSIQDDLEKTREGRTTIVVAHRLATVQNADVLFVLGGEGEERGRVVEWGPPRQLLRKKGVYWQMCQLQQLDR